jgi:hypothetical protein
VQECQIVASSGVWIIHGGVHTGVVSECSDGRFGLALPIECPALVGLAVGVLSTLDGDVGLTVEILAVEDEERYDLVGLPLLQVFSDVGFESGQASEGGQQGFAGRRGVEHQLEIVCRIDGDGAVFEVGDRGLAAALGLARTKADEGRGGQAYLAWPLIQSSSTSAVRVY